KTIEEVLRCMGELGHSLLPEGGGEALERVRLAEDRVQHLRVGVGRGLLQQQEVPAQRLGCLDRLGRELRRGPRASGAHATLRYFRTREMSWSAASGLMRNSDAPSWMPRSRSCCRCSPVTMISGVSR